ncbi:MULTISPECIES: hypothetical protein [Enterobacter cloacae complex]|uniref:hypothetical protein n=1 Tax=Enterobacter cloacae complex TaxID=354276 RepID=UPI0005EEEF24|nr:hypothetical protein [Enterobacter roggenkampii]EKY3955550.1 hypothetical protein [Enterobacter roggenkampii]EMC7878457.1 hypothetical protein [Enterobacter roggenkampii]KJP82155.1 hypothetical protein SR65_13570 [Enterobacter roggenkampii]KLP40010.1 hypothetical protein ABF66_04175 [Enterobacter roggenkampii]
MSYDDLDPATRRVLQQAEYMRSNEAKLAQIALIKHHKAYMDWRTDRGDFGDPCPSTKEARLELLWTRQNMLGHKTLNVLGFSFEQLYEDLDSALSDAIAARDGVAREWAAVSDVAELNALWEWFRERLPDDYVSPY